LATAEDEIKRLQ
jgi:chromosome segregation ATPase